MIKLMSNKKKKSKINYENRWVITEEREYGRERAILKLQGFRVTKEDLPSGSIMLVAKKRIQDSI